jgi:hypothetical protein
MKSAIRRRKWRCVSVLHHVALGQWRFCISFSQMHARYDFCDLCACVLRDVWPLGDVICAFSRWIERSAFMPPRFEYFHHMSGKHEGTPSVKLPTTVLLVGSDVETVFTLMVVLKCCTPKISSNVALVRRAVAQYCEIFREKRDCALLRWFSHTF